MKSTSDSRPPLIIGEVLFDHFPDGQKILGGAPFNVAWNLQGLGVPSVFVSAVGGDAQGAAIAQRMEQWKMDPRGLQTNSKSTGRVDVAIDNGQPSYEIVQGMAYDAIDSPEFPVTAEQFSLVYTGTLAMRSEQTRGTIIKLIQTKDLPRFVDVNIREPWFDESWLDHLFEGATWVKMNDEELDRLSGMPAGSQSEVVAAAAKMSQRYSIGTFLITCGSRGAYAIESDHVSFAPAPPPTKLVDTVGAGDAFAAATIGGIIAGRPLSEVIPDSVAFASKVCGLNGATSDDPSFYSLD